MVIVSFLLSVKPFSKHCTHQFIVIRIGRDHRVSNVVSVILHTVLYCLQYRSFLNYSTVSVEAHAPVGIRLFGASRKAIMFNW